MENKLLVFTTIENITIDLYTLSLPFLLHTRAFALFLTLIHTLSVFYTRILPLVKKLLINHVKFSEKHSHLYFLYALRGKKKPYSQQHTYQSHKVEEGQHSVSC